MNIDSDSAQVKIHPPLVALNFLLLGVALHWFLPFSFLPFKLPWLGTTFMSLGIVIILYCASLFKKSHTNIKPWKTTSSLITNNIYRFSRNPIYCAFILIGLGAALALNNLWIALLQIPLIFILTKWVIEKEERYLETKFGENYLAYKNKVRRWI